MNDENRNFIVNQEKILPKTDPVLPDLPEYETENPADTAPEMQKAEPVEDQQKGETKDLPEAPVQITEPLENDPAEPTVTESPETTDGDNPGTKKHKAGALLMSKIYSFTGQNWYRKYSPGLIVLLAVICIGSLSSGSSASEISELNAKIRKLTEENSEVQNSLESKTSEVISLTNELEELKNGKDSKLVKIRNAYDDGNWDETIKLAAEFHNEYNGSDQDKEAQSLKDQAQKNLDEAAAKKKAEEEAEAKRKAEEEARGYETGITYDQLARTPDDFVGEKVKFTGKVIQVLQDTDLVTIRLAIDSNYDQVILGSYPLDLTTSRVLEDDIITVYGTSTGEYTYTSTMKSSITVPSMVIEKIDQ